MASSTPTLVSLALLAPLLLTAGAARGEEPAAAPSLVERAHRAYDVGRFEAALIDYGRAYALDPRPALLFNLGQCHRQLGEYPRAAFLYRRFLALAPDSDHAPLARELAEEVEALERDQEQAAREEGLEQRRLQRARLETLRTEAAAQALARAALEARRLALVPAPGPDAATRAEAGEPPLLHRWWFWAGVGAVATGAAAAVALR